MRRLLIFNFLFFAVAEEAKFYHYQVRRVIPRTTPQVNALIQLQNGDEFDFWTEHISINLPTDIMIPPHKLPEFYEFVRWQGFEEEVIIKNVQELIDEESKEISKRKDVLDWTNYYSLREFEDWLDYMESTRGNVRKIVVGKTYEGRDINGLRIIFNPNYTTIFIESSSHGREWISSAVTSWIINELWESPADSVWRKFNYLYIPIFNPDGYVYSWTQNRLWKKTRKPYRTGFKLCHGADLDKNWVFQWKEKRKCSDPCSSSYPGPRALSEIEAKTMNSYLKNDLENKNINLYFSFHGYEPNIQNSHLNQKKNKKLQETMNSKHESETSNGFSKNIQPGSSLEWFVTTNTNGNPYVILVKEKDKRGFMTQPKHIIPLAKELHYSMSKILQEQEKHYSVDDSWEILRKK